MGACDGSAATSQTLAMDAPLSSASSATATLRPGTRKNGVTEPRLSVPSPSLCIRTESVSTAGLLLKGAAAGGAFDRHLGGLATFRHRLLIRGSLVRSQLGEPIFQRLCRRPLSGASVRCTISARVYCTGTAPSEDGEPNAREAGPAEVSRRRVRAFAR